MTMKFNQSAVADMAYDLAVKARDQIGPLLRVYGVPRGGVPVALAMSAHDWVTVVDDPAQANLVVDDVIDSGATMARYPGSAFGALVCKGPRYRRETIVSTFVDQGTWVTFPWEGSELGSASDICTRLLQYIGEDPTRGGLLETPARFLKAWKHYTDGYRHDPGAILKTFEDGATDELVLVKSIPVYSHCEHHLAPFFGVAHIGYVPNGKIVGLSKLSRLVDIFARRLQVQERLTAQIADAMQEHLSPLGIGVVVECRHMCMESRGVQRQGASTVTSAMRGIFRDDASARAELMKLIGG